jgi:hypothetical protein
MAPLEMTGMRSSTWRRDAPQTALQLSDVALKWMIDELDLLPEEGVAWNESKDAFLAHYRRRYPEAISSRINDNLKFSITESARSVLLWKFLGKLNHFWLV